MILSPQVGGSPPVPTDVALRTSGLSQHPQFA